jgi:hypothetical protein
MVFREGATHSGLGWHMNIGIAVENLIQKGEILLSKV